MGVWIETINADDQLKKAEVTPCVGVWIETLKTKMFMRRLRSHPAWVCGLKQGTVPFDREIKGHTLRGCVD